MSRGNRKDLVFADDRDRKRFLRILGAALRRYGGICFGYCLMGNHYHLVICTPHGNISILMHHVNGLYAQYVNWRHRLTGHLFGGPFTAIVIGDDIYLRSALAYVARNPLEAGFVDNACDWEWSSCSAVMGACTPPSFLTTAWLSELYPADTLEASRQAFALHVSRSTEDEYSVEDIVNGGADAKRQMRSVIGSTLYMARVPRTYRALGQPPLRELFSGVTKANRRSAVIRAHVVHGYRLAEIANFLELHPTTISRIVNRSGSYRR